MKKYVSTILVISMLLAMAIIVPTAVSGSTAASASEDFEAVSSVAELEAAGWSFSQGAGNQIDVVSATGKNGQTGKMLKLTKKAGTSEGISALKNFNYNHSDDIKKLVISYDVRLVNPDMLTGWDNGVIKFANGVSAPKIYIDTAVYTVIRDVEAPWSWAPGFPNAGTSHNFYFNKSGSEYPWVTVISTIDYTANTFSYATADNQNPAQIKSSQPLVKADSLAFKLDALSKGSDTEYYIDNITVESVSNVDNEDFDVDGIANLKGWTFTPGTGNTIDIVTAEAENGQQSKMLKLTKKAGTTEGMSALKNFSYIRGNAQKVTLSYKVRLVNPDRLTGWDNGVIKFANGVSAPKIYIDTVDWTVIRDIQAPWSWSPGSPNAGSSHNFYFNKSGNTFPWVSVISVIDYENNTVSYTTADNQNPAQIQSSQPLSDAESLVFKLDSSSKANDTEYYIDDVKIEAINLKTEHPDPYLIADDSFEDGEIPADWNLGASASSFNVVTVPNSTNKALRLSKPVGGGAILFSRSFNDIQNDDYSMLTVSYKMMATKANGEQITSHNPAYRFNEPTYGGNIAAPYIVIDANGGYMRMEDNNGSSDDFDRVVWLNGSSGIIDNSYYAQNGWHQIKTITDFRTKTISYYYDDFLGCRVQAKDGVDFKNILKMNWRIDNGSTDAAYYYFDDVKATRANPDVIAEDNFEDGIPDGWTLLPSSAFGAAAVTKDGNSANKALRLTKSANGTISFSRLLNDTQNDVRSKLVVSYKLKAAKTGGGQINAHNYSWKFNELRYNDSYASPYMEIRSGYVQFANNSYPITSLFDKTALWGEDETGIIGKSFIDQNQAGGTEGWNEIKTVTDFTAQTVSYYWNGILVAAVHAKNSVLLKNAVNMYWQIDDGSNESIDYYIDDFKACRYGSFGVTPGFGQTNISAETPLTLIFNNPINAQKLENALTLLKDGVQTPVTISLNNTDKIATITPVSGLPAYKTNYTLAISSDFEDEAGQKPASAFVYNFTTAGTDLNIQETAATVSGNGASLAASTTLTVTALVTNPTQNAKDGWLVAAAFGANGQMLAADEIILTDFTGAESKIITLTPGAGVVEVKVFLWSDPQNIIPYHQAVSAVWQ